MGVDVIIKVLLIGGVLVSALWLVRGQRHGARLAATRLAGLALAASGALSVLFPSAVTALAHVVGVGRGTDLVLYVLVVAFLLATIGLHQRIRQLEDRLTALTRAHALTQARVEDAHPAGDARA